MSCTPAELLNQSSCFQCLSQKQLLAISAMLLCDIVNKQSPAGPKVYRAILFDTPVPPTVLENTLGGVPVWSKDNVTGYYYLDLAGAFPASKTLVLAHLGASEPGEGLTVSCYGGAHAGSAVEVQVRTPQTGQDFSWTITNTGIENLYIEILVYP